MIYRNRIYKGFNDKDALYDVYLTDTDSDQMFVFVHGYMGYKDWGVWNLMANEIYKKGHSIAKLNLTHNGTTIDKPNEFSDLNSFGNGGYYKELMDVNLFLNHLKSEYKASTFNLIGHSRGGGIVLIAGQSSSVKEIHCLAPISSIAKRFPEGEELTKWKEDGVYYRKNGRTGQLLPHNYSQYEEFLEHIDELNIETICPKLNKSVFVYHGENDTSVLPIEGKNIATWTDGEFNLIKDTAHTFDAVEPWDNVELPLVMIEIEV